MADIRRPLLLALLTVAIIFSSSQSKDMPDKATVTNWANKVNDNLRTLNKIEAAVLAHYKNIQTTTYPGIQNVEIKTVEQETLVQEMADDLAESLARKTAALRETVTVAEDFAAEYSWNESIKKEDIGYENSKELLEQRVPLVFEDRFEKEVNYNFSGVHIPVEIFDGNKDILNGLNWTQALDEQFKINAQNDPEILWQYFGSQSGFMRTYPATPWPRKKVDLYDVRRQSWYTQGSSSPKDMMILIDKSGSTHGQSLQLMQNAVKSILDTLGENDFVNIVQFAEEASFVSRCFNHTPFVQANYRNKKQLERDVDGLEASGQADFSSALRFAFEKFKEFSRNETNDDENIGANCNKVIMLLTDGGTDNAEDIFEKYNWPNKTVRVFTYAVGPTPNPVHAVRWMACANRGYFSQIPAMGAIRARVQNYEVVLARDIALSRSKDAQWTSCEFNTFREWDKQLEYIPVLSRPQVIKNKKTFEWGNIYEDYLVDTRCNPCPSPNGLGMMTTVTLPVYNTSSASSNQTILGVVGIDVTTAQLEARTPFDQIGPIGYSFAINPNGYVVFHPNLKTSGKYMTEPPNVDILDLEIDEGSPDMNELRTEMINGRKGIRTIETLFLSPDQRYCTLSTAKYAYTFIKDTTFSLGLSVPVDKTKYFKFSGNIDDFEWGDLDENQGSGSDTQDFKVLLAPWNYHKNMSKMKDLTGRLQDIINLLNDHPNPDDWNLDLLYHLYWDTKLINDIKMFNSDGNDTSQDNAEQLSIAGTTFVMTSGGMTYVSPPSEAHLYESQRDPRKSSLFTRAQHRQGSCILSADHTNDNTSTSDVTITCSVPFRDEAKNIVDKPAVAGQRFSHSYIMEQVYSATDTNNSNFLTCRDAGLTCYILDDGGFLVAGNVEDPDQWIGQFIGEVDPVVFAALNGTVYGMVEQYDFQSTCKKESPTPNAGFPNFRIPSTDLLFEVLNVGWWSSKVSWALTSFSLYSWMTPEVTVFADDDEESDRKCVKAFRQYFLVNETFEHSTYCLNCSRHVTAVFMKKLNSLFVVASPRCEECEDDIEKVVTSPFEVTPEEAENIVCAMAQTPRTRLRSYACYHSDPREDVSECGCSGLYVSRLVSVVVLISVLWQWAAWQG